MKQKDIVLIIVVVFVSCVLSFVLSNFLFSASKTRQEQVEVVQPITSKFIQPDKKYFNDQSIDPTQLITIGGDNNNTPFKIN